MKLINLVTNEELDFDNKIFIQSEKELSYIDATHYSSQAIGQHGSYYTNTTMQPRTISIVGYVSATFEDFQSIKRFLHRFVNPTHEFKIIRNDKAIKGYPTSTVRFSHNQTEAYAGLYKFMIDIYCPTPFWGDVSDTRALISYWTGDFKFPLSITKPGIPMGHKNPELIVNVNNQGDIDTGMKIQFKALGSCNNPSLFNVNTREFIKINRNMVAGEIITINTNYGEKKITRYLDGDTSEFMNYLDLDSTFLQLAPGDNLFRYDAETNLNNLQVVIDYNPRYLGV